MNVWQSVLLDALLVIVKETEEEEKNDYRYWNAFDHRSDQE